MKRISITSIILTICLPILAGQPITLKQVVSGELSPETYMGITPMKDGESYAQLSKDKKQILKYSFKTGQQASVLFDAANTRGEKVDRIDGFLLSPDETHILVQTQTKRRYRHSFTAEYYIYTAGSRQLDALSKGGPQEQPRFSPDGNQIAFVRNGNLFLVKLLFNNSESQVTKDGQFNEIINGLPDWVNEEEFSWSQAFDFSADSKMLAWVKYDESQVQQFSFPLFKGSFPEHREYATYPGLYTYKYPKAGERNSRVSVQSYDIKSHVIRTLNVPMDSDGYIPRIKFTDTPDQLAIVTLNRHQNQMDIYMGNTRSLLCKLALRLQDERYVKEDAYQQLRFYGNHFVLLNDKGGNNQLYWYTTTGQLERQLTNGTDEVTQFYGYDAQTQSFYYQAKDGSPLRTAVFRTDLKGRTKKLTTQSGSNSALFSTSCKYFLHEYSNINTPPVTSLCNSEGRTEKVLVTNEELKSKLSQLNMPQKEFFSFQTSEGNQLNGWIMKPSPTSTSQKYPVILYQYSGPGSQQVLDSWRSGFTSGGLLEAYLNSKGFIVVCVDGRGTGGRGADWEKCTYRHLGFLEARDQVETALYVGSLPYVDKQNIGIWGWSYGGFNTLMSMSEGRPVFKAGVAIAPVTDFRFYDTVYTERYMRTPGENGDGYDYNAIKRADQLNGHLLICHGLADDNVHYQNTAEYAEALVQAGKQFDMQVYTNRNHSIYGGNTRLHLLTRLTQFFENHLK
ncbi:MAG: S9 family peptidase [Bacteroidaceae bacterium]|nr:S9 family peptidase [Bacteroidaceae bacterium]